MIPVCARIVGTSTTIYGSVRAIATTPAMFKGHSKWQNIKATKGKNDMIKSQTTNLLLRKVRGAVSRGGFDLKLNRELAGLEQDFRSNGLSLDTFKNFLQKIKDKPEIEYSFDVIGPSGTFFIIQAETSNKKAFESDLRKYFNKVGGFRLATDGGVRNWFEEKGFIQIDTKRSGKEVKLEEIEEIAIEKECEEVTEVDEDGRKFELVCDAKEVNKIEGQLSKEGFTVFSAEAGFRALHPVTVPLADSTKIETFYELLQEDEQVRQIYDNVASDEK
ncbi:unnamed protein product [Caenorhabditis auriculariae]|uniref:Uncharacterized protein n=1 Tax=Caenorhabditis auriculariae TaxID=2777116 RepID=A0A8S1HM24_9PELO|nr:unnamed protein product [Caenorhabditis auriculariae]